MSKSRNSITFIHLGENAKNKSGFSRKAYQLEVNGFSIHRTFGPVSLIGRKTKWERKPRVLTTKCKSHKQVRNIAQEIIDDRLAHGYRVAKPGEIPA